MAYSPFSRSIRRVKNTMKTTRMGKKTSDTYRNNRSSLLASANLDTDTRTLLQKQTDQQPQVFVRSVRTVR